MDYDYPGNVRELKSIIQSAWNLSQGKTITPEFLPSHLNKKKPALKINIATETNVEPLQVVEKEHIIKVYESTERNKAKTASLLAIGLNTLRRKLKSYGYD